MIHSVSFGWKSTCVFDFGVCFLGCDSATRLKQFKLLRNCLYFPVTFITFAYIRILKTVSQVVGGGW